MGFIQSSSRATALVLACTCGHADVVDLLIERGASLKTKDRLGRDLLAHASSRGHVAVVRRLLQTRPESLQFEVDDADRSPVHNAVVGDHAEALKVLIFEGGASWRRYRDHEWLMQEAERFGSFRCVKVLRVSRVPRRSSRWWRLVVVMRVITAMLTMMKEGKGMQDEFIDEVICLVLAYMVSGR